MKKFALLIVMFLLTVAVADAQGFFKKVGKEAKDKTADRTESTVDKAVDKAFDALDNLLTGKKDKKGKKGKKANNLDEDDEDEEEDGEERPDAGTWDCTNPECLHKGNTGKFCAECGSKRTVEFDAALNLYGVYASKKIAFLPGSAELKFQSFNEIQKIAEYIKNTSGTRLIVQVLYYNTAVDPKEAALAEDRAENIVKALVELGCDEFSLKAEDPDYGPGVPEKDRANLKGLYVVFTKK